MNLSLKRNFSCDGDPGLEGLTQLRQRVVSLALIYLTLLSSPILLLAIFHAAKNGVNWYFCVQLLCYLSLLVGLKLRTRVCNHFLSLFVVAVVATVGLSGVMAWGPAPSRMIVVSFACVFAAIFNGTRASISMIALSSVAMTVIALLKPLSPEIQGGDSISDHSPHQWFVTIASFTLYTSVGSLLVSWVANSLQKTIVQLKSNERELAEANERLMQQAVELEEQAVSLTEQRNLAQSSARAKERFLTIISHELNTPLNPIIGFLKLIETNDSLSEEVKSQVGLMRRSANHLHRLVSRVVNYSELGRNEVACNPSKIQLKELARELQRRQAATAIDAEIDQHIDANGTDDYSVLLDKRLTLDALEELVANAIKYTKKGSVNVAFRLEPRPDDASKATVRIKVSDTGCGIPKDDLKTLFESFVQSDESKTRKFSGIGIGLTVSDLIVSAMDGKITVQSEEGVGSVFEITIPNCPISSAQENKKTSQSSNRLSFDEPLKILIVEDDFVNRRVVSSFLKKMGTESVCVENGLEAVEQLESSNYDLVLMDLSMPVMDGITATRIIRERKIAKETPIVALTAHSIASTECECYQAGMNAFLNKPVKYPELFDTIESLTRSLPSSQQTFFSLN